MGVLVLDPLLPIVEIDEKGIAWVQVEDGVGNISDPLPLFLTEPPIRDVYLPLILRGPRRGRARRCPGRLLMDFRRRGA